jgi:hypothetical protein
MNNGENNVFGDIMHKLDWEYSQERLGLRACLIRGISFGNLSGRP